ncbi:MAG: hypothetical protein LH472_12395 [Pyrinomonadaceae bacterium]|nr:hypothetical protein [Pyrinomonadaceae bacterium]
MESETDKINEETRQTAGLEADTGGSDIGAGKKTGLYGCAFMILAIVIVFIVLVLTGIYNPFQGTEGVGP